MHIPYRFPESGLMLALPEQTLTDFERTVRKAIDLAPSSLSYLDLRVAPESKLHEMGYYLPDGA